MPKAAEELTCRRSVPDAGPAPPPFVALESLLGGGRVSLLLLCRSKVVADDGPEVDVDPDVDADVEFDTSVAVEEVETFRPLPP